MSAMPGSSGRLGPPSPRRIRRPPLSSTSTPNPERSPAARRRMSASGMMWAWMSIGPGRSVLTASIMVQGIRSGVRGGAGGQPAGAEMAGKPIGDKRPPDEGHVVADVVAALEQLEALLRRRDGGEQPLGLRHRDQPVVGPEDDHEGPLDQGCCVPRSEEHTSELQSLMRSSYAVVCLK